MTYRAAFSIVILVTVAAGARAVLAQAGLSGNAQAVDAYVTGRVAAGEMDQGGAEAAIASAYSNGSLSQAEFDKLTDKVRRDFDQLKKDTKDQNPVFTADWPFGGVFPGHVYNTTLEVTNGCSAAQTVSVTYPANMFLKGPASIDVPGHGKVDAPIAIDIPPLQIPPNQPVPIMLPPCPLLSGEIRVEHPKVGRCLAMKRVYTVSMQLHLHPEPDAGQGNGGGGGGGGKKKKMSPACDTLWNRAEFAPTRERPSPDACVDELREAAAALDQQVEPERKKDPGAWAWMPPNSDLAGMTAAEILAWRQRLSDQSVAAAKEKRR
jgi:hypothetical protein